jgi:hypothetical protein
MWSRTEKGRDGANQFRLIARSVPEAPPTPSPRWSIHLFFSLNYETVNFHRDLRVKGVREKTRRNPKKCG